MARHPEPPEEANRPEWNQRRRQQPEASEELLDKVRFRNSDRWLARYLAWLEHEIHRLNSGPIGRHYLRCAAAAYDDLAATKCPRARYRAWLGVRTCCQWLSQLEGAV
jgi:hypothetical protein